MNQVIINFLVFIFFVSITGCKSNASKSEKLIISGLDYSIDTSTIPNDTLDFSNQEVVLINGIYYLDDQKFSGFVKKHISRVKVTSYSAVLNGKLHGTYRSFFKDGSSYETRNYKNNLATGKHYYNWKSTGKLRYSCMYHEGKKEGLQKKWYANGTPFIFLNYKNNKLEGKQQAWRKNGKLYINYEAKNGKNYGLQRSAPCYDISNGDIKKKTKNSI